LIFNEYINGRYYFCKNSFKGPMGKAQSPFYLSKYKKNKQEQMTLAIFAFKSQAYGYSWLF